MSERKDIDESLRMHSAAAAKRSTIKRPVTQSLSVDKPSRASNRREEHERKVHVHKPVKMQEKIRNELL